MVSKVSRSKVREEKHRRMRRHIIGTPERPRMAVFRSNNHMYVQIIDDVAKTTLVSASTLQKDVKEKLEKTNDVAAAAYLGTVIAKKAQEAGITSLLYLTEVASFIRVRFRHWQMQQEKLVWNSNQGGRRHMKRTNIDATQFELADTVVAIKRVSKTVKGGRTMRFSALVVVGDRNGHVGVGMGKAAEIPEAIRKGKQAAEKNMITVPLDENKSIPHDFIGKFGSASVLLKKVSGRYRYHRRRSSSFRT